MKEILTTSVTKLSSLFQLVEEAGISRQTLLQKAGILPSILNSPDNRLSLSQVHQLTQAAIIVTGDNDLGLHQGERYANMGNILGYVMMNCVNMRQAFEKLILYQKICDEGTTIKVSIQTDTAAIQIFILDATLEKERHLIDYRLSGIFTQMKRLTGVPCKLTKVWLCHEKPEKTGEYHRIFQCPVEFDRPVSAIQLNRRYLDLSLPAPNRLLLKKFEELALEALNSLPRNDAYTKQVGRIIAARLQGETPAIETVARQLAMSVRNLQLKLQVENTTYSRILSEVRKNMAIHYLKDKNTPISEIAFLLGYAEVSVFQRAFRKWTRTTPAVFRQHVLLKS